MKRKEKDWCGQSKSKEEPNALVIHLMKYNILSTLGDLTYVTAADTCVLYNLVELPISDWNDDDVEWNENNLIFGIGIGYRRSFRRI